MQKIVFCLVFLVVAASTKGQQPAKALWARGGPDFGEWSWASMHYSDFTHTLIATTVDGEWLNWPLGPISLPKRKLPSNINGSLFTSVLVRDGKELITGTFEGDIYSWDLTNDSISFITATAGFEEIEWIDASQDGSLIAFCSPNDNVLHVYDRNQGKEIITWSNSRGDVSFSPDGKLLLAGAPPQKSNSQGTMALIDVANRKVIRTFDNIVNEPAPVAFNPVYPGRFVVQDNHLYQMDTSGKILNTYNIGTTAQKSSVAYSPSGNLLAIGVGGGMVVLNLSSGVTSDVPGGGYPAFVSEDSIATTVNEQLELVSVSEAAVISVLSTAPSYDTRFVDQNDLYVYGTPVNPVTGQDEPGDVFPTDWVDPYLPIDPTIFSPGGSMACTRTSSGVYFWANRHSGAFFIPDSIVDTVCGGAEAFSPDSSLFAFAIQHGCSATSNGESTLEIWSTTERQKLFSHYLDLADAPQSIVFSDDGTHIAVSDANTCEVFNAQTGAFVSEFIQSKVLSFYSGDSSLLCEGYYICSLDGTILRTLPSSGHTEILRLPDGKYIVGYGPNYVAYSDSILAFFDLQKGIVTNEFTALEGWSYRNPQALAVNPVTGDFAMGGRDLIYYKSIDPEPSSVTEFATTFKTIQAYASTSRITLVAPVTGDGVSESGKIFIYNALGECCYTQEVKPGERSITTGALSAGDYFIVLQTAGGGKYFTKVSLFQ